MDTGPYRQISKTPDISGLTDDPDLIRLAEKYTRIFGPDPESVSARIVVGVQSFSVVEDTDEERATWFCYCITTALRNFLKMESK